VLGGYISVSCWKLCVDRARINTSNRSLGTIGDSIVPAA